MASLNRETASGEPAHAKVNLTLKVLGRRDDGYHELLSLVAFASLGDRVAMRLRPPHNSRQVKVSGPFAGGIGGENLLTKALALLRTANPGLVVGPVLLDKRLPVAAGLGGGSADAAALLRLVRSLNPRLADDIPWLEIAAELGSDVPVCFAGHPAVIQGRGERMSLVRCLPGIDVVLVNPRIPLSTARVFAAMQAGPAPHPVAAAPAPSFSGLADLLGYMREHGNDMEPAAAGLLPVIGEIKALLAAQPGCHHAAMSGSGPTCVGIFASEAEARSAMAALRAVRPDWWIESTRLMGVP